MAQSQVTKGGKYARAAHAPAWTWIAFAVAFLAAILVIGFRFGGYHVAIDAVDAVRSAVIGPAGRVPVEAEQRPTKRKDVHIGQLQRVRHPLPAAKIIHRST